MTWEELWAKYATGRRLTVTSIRTKRDDLKQFLTYSQASTPMEVTSEHLNGFFLEQKQRTSGNTAGMRLRTVLALLRWAVRQQYLVFDPGENFVIPKPRRPIPRILSVEEVERLLEAPLHHRQGFTGVRDAAILEVLYSCGLRACELAGLDLDQVDLADESLTVKVSKGNPRRVPLGKVVSSRLAAYRDIRHQKAQPLETAFFVSTHGYRMPASRLSSLVQRYGQQLGIADATPHALRRAFATHMLQNGANLVELKALLGHADIDSTLVYAQILPTGMMRAYRQSHPRARADRKKPK